MMKNKAMRCVWLVCGLLMLAVTSCKDDLLYTDGEPIPEGETTIIAQVDFRPLVEGLAGKSRTAGDAIKSIQDLCVLLYDTEGNFVEGHSLESISNANPTDGQFYVNEVTRKDGDAPDGGTIAETKTPSKPVNVGFWLALLGTLPLLAGITGKCITSKCIKYGEVIKKIRV